MILTAKNITKEPTTITISYDTKDGSSAFKKYIAAGSEVEIMLPNEITLLTAFSDFPDSVVISGVI